MARQTSGEGSEVEEPLFLQVPSGTAQDSEPGAVGGEQRGGEAARVSHPSPHPCRAPTLADVSPNRGLLSRPVVP